MNFDKFKKSVQILNFFAEKEGGTIDKMKALKLYWLSDKLHLRKYGRLISSDKYLAMEYGAVASTAKDIIDSTEYLTKIDIKSKNYRDKYLTELVNNSFSSKSNTDLDEFSQSDIEILELIYENFKFEGAFSLSELSHKFPEWQKFENDLKINPRTRHQMDLKDFFLNPETMVDIFSSQPEEEINNSKEYFEEFNY